MALQVWESDISTREVRQGTHVQQSAHAAVSISRTFSRMHKVSYIIMYNMSSGHEMSAKIAEWASWIYVHVFCGAKRQFLELCLETYIKMSGHSARSCLHLAESGQNKIDVTPHDWSAHSPWWVQTYWIWVRTEKNDETVFNGRH